MGQIILTEQLIEQGFSRDEITKRRRLGELTALRRGAYLLGTAEEPDAEIHHRRLIEATAPQLTRLGVLSYTSAAVLYGLPVWPGDLDKVHVTRPRFGGGGKKRSVVRLHAQPLETGDVSVIDGLSVTSLERTVFDLARVLPYERAVAAGDRALALGMSKEILSEMLERGRRWSGIGQARRTADFIDVRAESAGESVSRVRCADFGLPAPQPQLPVTLPNGTTVYGDFGWPELMTIGEFDGRVKYEKFLRPGETAADAVTREKRREDRLRALGWQIVRWIWKDLHDFGPIYRELLAAFERGRHLAAIT